MKFHHSRIVMNVKVLMHTMLAFTFHSFLLLWHEHSPKHTFLKWSSLWGRIFQFVENYDQNPQTV